MKKRIVISLLLGMLAVSAAGCSGKAAEATSTAQKMAEDMSADELLEAAENGNGRAYTTLGNMYENGEGGVEQDYQKALKYYLLSAEAENADFKGLRYAALMYYNGVGVEQDYDKAMEYFEQSADAGDISSAYYLGNMYENGIGVEVDYSKALSYYEMAIAKLDEYLANDKNNGPDELKEALCALANMYENGIGVEADQDKADEYYGYAAELGWDVSTNSEADKN
ncbi:MAG: sel1 repeat family protein [Lachnospiraceae bacterium]|nr:sel1 repeat family protein [Lachnospiraceae bacterium]